MSPTRPPAAERVQQHSALHQLRIPFNRINISSQLSLYLPCHNYKVTESNCGASLFIKDEGVTYSIPMMVTSHIPPEMLKCFDQDKLCDLIVTEIHSHLHELNIDIEIVGVYNLEFLKG